MSEANRTSKHVTNFAGDCISTCPACSKVQQRLRAALSLAGECLSRGYWKIGTELTQRANAAIIEALSGDSTSPSETTRDDARDAVRYRWLRDWYHREGKRAEIDPYGHIAVRTLPEWEALLDAAIARSSPEEPTPAPLADRLAILGYAPGGYSINCMDCKEVCNGCDKRALRCHRCALARDAEKASGDLPHLDVCSLKYGGSSCTCGLTESAR